jgi:hypothetical protein
VAVAGVWLVNQNASLRARLALAAPLILGGAVLAAFKLLYYGDLFPTAFYSKSALDPYYSQGLFYVYLPFKKNWFLCPLVIGLITLALAQRVRPSQLLNRRDLVLLAAFVAFVAYVAHSGGDFMFAAPGQRRSRYRAPSSTTHQDLLVSDVPAGGTSRGPPARRLAASTMCSSATTSRPPARRRNRWRMLCSAGWRRAGPPERLLRMSLVPSDAPATLVSARAAGSQSRGAAPRPAHRAHVDGRGKTCQRSRI